MPTDGPPSSPGARFEAIIQLARMRNWDDFRAAAANWAVPAQNLAYADAEGNIGYQTPGSIPIRRGYSGKYPVPGWDSAYGWDGYIPFDALPNMLNPDSGLVVTANNAAIGEQYPYLLTDDWDYGYRAQRITDLLEQATAERRPVDGAGLSAIQLDTYSAVAADLVPRMQACVSGLDEQTAAAFALFEGWDFHDDVDSAPLPTSTRSGATCRSRCSTTSSAPTRARRAAAGGGSWPIRSGSVPTTRGGTTPRPRRRRPGTPPWRLR